MGTFSVGLRMVLRTKSIIAMSSYALSKSTHSSTTTLNSEAILRSEASLRRTRTHTCTHAREEHQHRRLI